MNCRWGRKEIKNIKKWRRKKCEQTEKKDEIFIFNYEKSKKKRQNGKEKKNELQMRKERNKKIRNEEEKKKEMWTNRKKYDIFLIMKKAKMNGKKEFFEMKDSYKSYNSYKGISDTYLVVGKIKYLRRWVGKVKRIEERSVIGLSELRKFNVKMNMKISWSRGYVVRWWEEWGVKYNEDICVKKN